MSIYLFCEGQTEKYVVQQFAKLVNPENKGQGKTQVNNQMTNTLGPLLNQPQAVQALVMRDVDKDETPESIVQSVTRALQTLLQERDFSVTVQFQPDGSYPNVYRLSLSNPNLRLALHLSTYKWKNSFANATIDDYVLALALQETTAAIFLAKKGWTTTPEQIIRKVTERIPTLLQENSIPVNEAKDYVRLYAAVIQEHASPAVFAQKTLSNGRNEDKRSVFAPLLAALDFLGEPQP